MQYTQQQGSTKHESENLANTFNEHILHV